MRVWKSAPLFIIVVMVLLSLTARGANALEINSVRLGVHPDKIRLVLDLSEKSEFRVFTLENARRLAIDLPAFNWQAGAIEKPSGSHVRDIRQGSLQPGLSRIVIDLDNPVIIKSVFFLPRDGHKSDRLVIDFAGASAAVATAGQSKVYGRLNAPTAAAAPPPPVAATSSAPRPVALPPEKTPSAQVQIAAVTGMALPSKKPPNIDNAAPLAPAPARPATKKLIVIDPGHGGADPGAKGANGLYEKNITLAIAKELKKQLEATGHYTVKMTRDNDTYLRLYKRVDFARQNKADLFISLHADSINKAEVRGASIYTLSDKASDEQTEALAMRENRADLIAGVDLSAEDDMVVNILVDLTMRDTMNQSRFLANTVARSLKNGGIKTLETPHRYAGFAVLKAPDIPSILVEMGFMSNKNEANLLSQPDFQQKIAQNLAHSINAYFAKVGENSPT